MIEGLDARNDTTVNKEHLSIRYCLNGEFAQVGLKYAFHDQDKLFASEQLIVYCRAKRLGKNKKFS